MDANNLNPSTTDGKKTDVLLALNKQTNKVNAVKGIDEDGKLHTVPPTQNHSSDFMRVDKNSDLFPAFFSSFFRKLKETEGFGFFKSDASQVEESAKAILGNAEKPTPEGGKLFDMLKVEKPDFSELPKNNYHIDPAKIDWESLPIIPVQFQLIPRQVRVGKEKKADPGVLKQLKIIKEIFNQCDKIIVTTDAGREGELIFRYIYQHIGCNKPFVRLWISSLTDKAIREGLEKLQPGDRYDNLYHSA